jgi:hypothetical protein
MEGSRAATTPSSGTGNLVIELGAANGLLDLN